MVGWLIKLVGRSAAKKIEQGSALGATVGATLAGGAGVCAAYLLYRIEAIDGWAAPAVTLGVAGALAGGLFGSLFRLDGPRAAAPWDATVNDTTTVRLTNLNHALAPIVIFAALTALLAIAAVAALVQPDKVKSEFGDFDVRLIAFPLVYVVATGASIRAVLWIDLGRELRVRRLLGTRVYRTADVPDWGFAGEDGVPVRQPPAAGSATLVLLLPGRGTLRLPVDPEKARRAAEVIARHVR